MPILSFSTDKANGIITIVASGEHLSDDFFNGTQAANASLSITDGQNSINSDYIPLVPKSKAE
jgi:hypothetical protein